MQVLTVSEFLLPGQVQWIGVMATSKSDSLKILSSILDSVSFANNIHEVPEIKISKKEQINFSFFMITSHKKSITFYSPSNLLIILSYLANKKINFYVNMYNIFCRFY